MSGPMREMSLDEIVDALPVGTEGTRHRARAERDQLRADLARISEEMGLPPTIGPAPGELRRIMSDLATARAEVERLKSELRTLRLKALFELDKERARAATAIALEEAVLSLGDRRQWKPSFEEAFLYSVTYMFGRDDVGRVKLRECLAASRAARDQCEAEPAPDRDRKPEPVCADCQTPTDAGPCPGCGKVVCQVCAERECDVEVDAP